MASTPWVPRYTSSLPSTRIWPWRKTSPSRSKSPVSKASAYPKTMSTMSCSACQRSSKEIIVSVLLAGGCPSLGDEGDLVDGERGHAADVGAQRADQPEVALGREVELEVPPQ